MDNNKKLHHLEFLSRENLNRHHRFDEEMYQYELLKRGDSLAIEESSKMLSSNLPGHVSDNPVRNYKYLFVASITIATRAAILGGMKDETAYNISDLFILKMDTLETIQEIKDLHKEMFSYFVEEIKKLKRKNSVSKKISLALDYIYFHLHEKIKLEDLAKELKLSQSYLSLLFKKEMGISITDYICKQRIEAAKNMLKFSDYSLSEISSYLAFNSQSYFQSVFKREVGLTPKKYRDMNSLIYQSYND